MQQDTNEYNVTQKVISLLSNVPEYKAIAEAATARIEAGEDSDAVGRELLETTLSKPMQDCEDYDQAAYAIEAFLEGAFDWYYLDTWNTTRNEEMQQLIDSLISDVAWGKRTPREAAETFAATLVLRDAGYPDYSIQMRRCSPLRSCSGKRDCPITMSRWMSRRTRRMAESTSAICAVSSPSGVNSRNGRGAHATLQEANDGTRPGV